jgi:hypothetical protein
MDSLAFYGSHSLKFRLVLKTWAGQFDLAVEQVRQAAHTLIHSLTTNAAPRDRESLREKAMADSAKRFGNQYRPV